MIHSVGTEIAGHKKKKSATGSARVFNVPHTTMSDHRQPDPFPATMLVA
jgi:hypothetical protein